ncbi:sigma-70 family RNA polymerase sigma factor [Nocardia sp. CDC153]|uniref:sigma-70 family RNA polymerase sigma factor n=1 Tax=Nocardia sp. CDC153 TaxID=3112167 RepID=UPI002DBF7296|nr:sigma-70 family RNA polymerase sigma factor [Nocardia sp. CDC153]MEC3956021.1 sigma-70 family RNA polymerase sigma factor [Nocardia sp. CDC153]
MPTRPGNLVTEAFEDQRERLRAVAFRMLGSHADAEDVVQEAWMRLARHDGLAIENLTGWLTTVVGRISLDLLRSRSTRSELSYEEGISDILIVDDAPEPPDHVALADSVGLALLVVLDSLAPSERLAFVLHDMFGVPFAEIGQILGKSPDATKMIASRARRKVRSTDRPTGSGREQREVALAFRRAALRGDFEALLRVLDPEVKLTVETPSGSFVTLGATEVASRARMFSGEVSHHQPVLVDGLPGYLAWREDGTPLSLSSFSVTHHRITALTIIADPARLAAMDLPGRLGSA